MDYYANFRPYGDVDGHFHTTCLTIFDKVDTNKRKLKDHVVAYCTYYPFPSYPVVLDIMRDTDGVVVDSFIQTELGGGWKRNKGEGH